MDSLARIHLTRHLTIGVPLYLACAALDATLTIRGMGGDLAMEGSPVMRAMMVRFGITGGLIFEKGLVLLAALLVAVAAFRGIHREAVWVYRLALTPATRNWMRKQRRYGVAFLPLYLAAGAQGLAAAGWLWVMSTS